MQRNRIYLLFAANTIVWCGLVLFFIPGDWIESALVITVGMTTALIASVVLVSIVINKLTTENAKTLGELKITRHELGDLQSRFAEVTTMDDLTGCWNYHHFLDLLQRHSAMTERGVYEFALVVIRVDQYVKIVEEQGLARGNDVLQLFSRIVKATLREVDALARLEDDKFGLILSECSEEDAMLIVNRINQLVNQIRVNNTDDLKITASGGVTCFHGSESPEVLIAHGDEALQFAVDQGGDRFAGYSYQESSSASGDQ